MAGGQSTSRLLKKEIELYLPLENKLGADELALCTHRLDPGRQEHRRLPGTGLEPHLVRECKGFFLYGTQQVILSLVLLLAEIFRPAVGHAAAHRPFRRLTGRDIYRKVHPQQHLPGVEDPGLGAAQPWAGQHRSPLGQAGSLRLTGEGQPHLHPPQAAAALGLVEDTGPHHAGDLGSALPGLLAAQHRLTAHIHNAQDIGAGIGYDALQGLLLAQGNLRHRLIADDGITFKFHGILSLVIHRVSTRIPALLAGIQVPLKQFGFVDTICQGVRMYATFPALFHLKYPAQQPPQAPGGTYHHDTHENASPPCWICR